MTDNKQEGSPHVKIVYRDVVSEEVEFCAKYIESECIGILDIRISAISENSEKITYYLDESGLLEKNIYYGDDVGDVYKFIGVMVTSINKVKEHILTEINKT